MAKVILMDEVHLTVFAPAGLRPAEYGAIRRTLAEARFRTRLGRAVRDVFRQYPSFSKVRITITR